MSRIEIEVKLLVKDPAEIERRIREAGARLLHPREFEDNVLYDFPDGSLARRGAMLRLRLLERAAFLTFKDNPRIEAGAKLRDEIESTLLRPEAESFAAILAAVGFVQVFRYQKYRTTWEAGGLLITLDETPVGHYLELEGERPLIDRIAARLGYSAADYMASSYRELYLSSRRDRGEPRDQMLFSR